MKKLTLDFRKLKHTFKAVPHCKYHITLNNLYCQFIAVAKFTNWDTLIGTRLEEKVAKLCRMWNTTDT